MNRRKFFSFLGAGVAAVAVAPATLLPEGPKLPSSCTCFARTFWEGECEYCEQRPRPVQILGYADYTSFSTLATKEAIDDIVMNAARELGTAAGLDIDRTIRCGL